MIFFFWVVNWLVNKCRRRSVSFPTEIESVKLITSPNVHGLLNIEMRVPLETGCLVFFGYFTGERMPGV